MGRVKSDDSTPRKAPNPRRRTRKPSAGPRTPKASAPGETASRPPQDSPPPHPPPLPPGRDRRGWPIPVALALLGPFLALEPEERPDPLEAPRRFKALLDEAAAVLAGIEAYQSHPLPPRRLDRPVLWSAGGARLLDYGGEGPVAVAVPSLVNRATVLDLLDERSFMAGLAASGVRALLLDWGEPSAEDLALNLEGYARARLAPALRRAAEIGGEPPALMGYCMAGALCVGALSLEPNLARRFAAVAAPWDFRHMPGLAGLRRKAKEISAGLEAAEAVFGAAPGEALQTLFSLRDPWAAARKFRDFSAWSPASFQARLFVALEDWANDGAPLASKVAREAFHDWFLGNKPHRGRWRLGEHRVDPRRFGRPALVVTGSRDALAPPEAARPLAEALPRARALEVSAGHVGLIMGGGAAEQVWGPLAAFFVDRTGDDATSPRRAGSRRARGDEKAKAGLETPLRP